MMGIVNGLFKPISELDEMHPFINWALKGSVRHMMR